MGFSTFPNNPFPPSTAQFDEGKNEAIQAEIDAIKDGTNIDSFGDVETALASKANTADVNTALATKTNISNIAPTFNATSGVYAVGDKVIYEGVLYEFTSAHSTVGEWDESEVQPVKISELIDSLKSGLTNVHLITSTTHTIAGYYTEIGNAVIATGYFDPTDISSEQVKTNLPQPEGGFPIMWRDSTNGNLGEAFVAYENGTYIGTYGHTGTITVGNYIQFSFAYIKRNS